MTRVSDGGPETTRPPVQDQGPGAPSAHRRPGYSLSGCTPAEPDSASPGEDKVAYLPAEPQREGSGRATVIPRTSGRGRHRRAAPGKQDTPVHKGRMPLKKSSDFGRSRGRCLDFLLLIGAFAARPLFNLILETTRAAKACEPTPLPDKP